MLGSAATAQRHGSTVKKQWLANYVRGLNERNISYMYIEFFDITNPWFYETIS